MCEGLQKGRGVERKIIFLLIKLKVVYFIFEVTSTFLIEFYDIFHMNNFLYQIS